MKTFLQLLFVFIVSCFVIYLAGAFIYFSWSFLPLIEVSDRFALVFCAIGLWFLISFMCLLLGVIE